MATNKTKRKTKKPSEVKPKAPQGKYLLTVYLNDKIYSTRTDDIARSILDLKPTKITNKVRIIVEEGNKKIEKMLFVFPARRLFSMPIATQFFAKNIILGLK